MLRIGFFINSRAARGAICAYELCERLNECDHKAQIYAIDFDEYVPQDIRRVFTPPELEDPAWWKVEALDAAVFYGVSSFLPSALTMARRGGATVVVECDNDGALFFLASAI